MTNDQRVQSRLRSLTRVRAESDRIWREAICEAHAGGMSLRDISKHVGVAHSRVAAIVKDGLRREITGVTP